MTVAIPGIPGVSLTVSQIWALMRVHERLGNDQESDQLGELLTDGEVNIPALRKELAAIADDPQDADAAELASQLLGLIPEEG